jgi:hypothetical protein
LPRGVEARFPLAIAVSEYPADTFLLGLMEGCCSGSEPGARLRRFLHEVVPGLLAQRLTDPRRSSITDEPEEAREWRDTGSTA